MAASLLKYILMYSDMELLAIYIGYLGHCHCHGCSDEICGVRPGQQRLKADHVELLHVAMPTASEADVFEAN